MTDKPSPGSVSELLPCPFCGNCDPFMRYEWQVCCGQHGTSATTCACEGPFANSEAEAIAAWNTRATTIPASEATDQLMCEYCRTATSGTFNSDLCQSAAPIGDDLKAKLIATRPGREASPAVGGGFIYVENSHRILINPDGPGALARIEELEAGLRRLSYRAKFVMDMLEEDGPKVVPHLIDTDDNPGEYLRQAIDEARTLLKEQERG